MCIYQRLVTVVEFIFCYFFRYNRDWRFHKDERVWITRVPGMNPTEKSPTYERGMYYFFDADNWRKVAKEFHLDYERLEERPIVPPAVTNLSSTQSVIS